MTVASDAVYAHALPASVGPDAASATKPRNSERFAAEGAVPMSIIVAFLAIVLGWVGATVLFGLAGLIVGAEVMTALAFATVLTLTRA